MRSPETILLVTSTGRHHELRISERVTANGNRVICLRKWYLANGEWRPGRDGIELRRETLAKIMEAAQPLRTCNERATPISQPTDAPSTPERRP